MTKLKLIFNFTKAIFNKNLSFHNRCNSLLLGRDEVGNLTLALGSEDGILSSIVLSDQEAIRLINNLKTETEVN